MRQFYLENEKGERKGLNGELGVRLGNPAGLGVVFEHKVSEVGKGFFRLEEKKLKNEPFTCDLTFLPAAFAFRTHSAASKRSGLKLSKYF